MKLIYLFGSYAQGTQHCNSDIDIAVLADVTLDNIARWLLAQKLTSALDTDVDLVDLRTASTVLCQQVVTQRKQFGGRPQDDELFAVKTISMYQHLQAERQAIIDDVTANTTANDHREVTLNDIIINKITTIKRGIKRIQQVYGDGSKFKQDFTLQDSVTLNLQRCCEASIDIANHINRQQQLGIPQSSRDSFTLLTQNNVIAQPLANNLKKMVGLGTSQYMSTKNSTSISLCMLYIILRILSNLLK